MLKGQNWGSIVSFGVFVSNLITKAIQDWGEFFGIHGKVMESSETWRTKALKSSSTSKSGMQGGEAKRNLTWSIQEGSNCQPVLEYFLELNLSILYVISKLGKSAIQLFKWCTIQSWNEGVRAIGSRSHQAEDQFCMLRNQPLAAKWCPSTCEILQPSCTPAKSSWVLPDICDWHF